MHTIERWHCWWPWATPNPSKHPMSTFCIAFQIFKFCTLVGHVKY